MNCQNDDQIKEMTELRRKIKNRVSHLQMINSIWTFWIFNCSQFQDAAQRSRQKRIETTKKLKDENDSLQDMHKEVKQRYEEKLRENEDIKKKILQKEQEKEYFLQRKRVRLCQQVQKIIRHECEKSCPECGWVLNYYYYYTTKN